MAEKQVGVIIDEDLSKKNKKSFLMVELTVNGKKKARVDFWRQASPQQISDSLNEAGCFMKYEEDIGLSEEDKRGIGELYIQASYNVPGLGKK